MKSIITNFCIRYSDNLSFEHSSHVPSTLRETCGLLDASNILHISHSCWFFYRKWFKMYTNFVYLLFLLFVLEFIVLYVGAQDKNIAYSAGSQPEFSFRQQDKARLLIHWNIRKRFTDTSGPGHFGTKTVRVWSRSVSRHFGTIPEMSGPFRTTSGMVPNCLETLRH